MKHVATYVTEEYHWLGFNDEPRHEPRTFWTCSCGHNNAKSGHAGGYTTQRKAEYGHKLHSLRSPIKETS
jgi:hypothetical protein